MNGLSVAHRIDASEDTAQPLPGMPVVPIFEQIRIENTNLCGYRCRFCPREKMTRPAGVMPLSDLSVVLDRVGMFAGRVDLHGFGEPLLDPDLIDRIRLVKDRWPASSPVIYSTLGVAKPAAYFSQLLSAGLARLEVSFYGKDTDEYAAIHGVRRYALARKNLDIILSARATSDTQIVVRRNPEEFDSEPSAAQQRLRAVLAAEGVKFTQRALHNFGDGRKFNAAGTGTSCSVVSGFRRRVLQVTWDLEVIPCCFDSNASVVLGNLRHQSLREIFSGAPYRRFIGAHIDDELGAYPVCSSCERCTLP